MDLKLLKCENRFDVFTAYSCCFLKPGLVRALCCLILFASLMTTLLPAKVAAQSKAGELQARIADLTLLERQLTDRQQEIDALREELGRRRTGLVTEIVQLQKSLAIDSFDKAVQQPRISHNLEILRLIAGFNRALETKWGFYQNGCNRLNFLLQSAQDDLRMVTTLNNLKVDALTTQISLVINGYLPEAHTMQIDPSTLNLPVTRAVWDDIATHRLK